MPSFLAYLLILSLFHRTKCELSLKILKRTGDYITPVSSKVVEEKAGANFSLLCDLVSSEVDSDFYDFQVSWVKLTALQQADLRFWREQDSEDGKSSKKIYSILKPSEVNKAVKHFFPLKPEDKGKYFCVSLKYDLHEVVELVVQDEKRQFERPVIQETIFCSTQMFQCLNGVCIIHHYICDGKEDCKDGSDESYKTCGAEPCKDKLKCDDGRCIPMSWCCERHRDANCTVRNRPECCQMLVDPDEELEFQKNLLDSTYSKTNYAYISISTLFILFFIVVLLIFVSKALLTEKTEAQPRNVTTVQTISGNSLPLLRNFSYSYQNSGGNRNLDELIITDDCDVSDPLLLGRADDQPPSYIDVIKAENCRLSLNEPPPPYTSREVLNDDSGNVQQGNN